MTQIDLNKIFNLKKLAMKNCEKRIHEAASRPPTEIDDPHGITTILRKRHGL